MAWLLTVSKNGSPLSTITVVVMVISYPFLEKAMRISEKAFIARVNRKIADQDLKLRVASRWTTDTLNYFVACENCGYFIDRM